MPRLPRKLTGTSPQVVEWNAMVDYLLSLRQANSPNTLSMQTPHGVIRKAQPQAPASAQPQQDGPAVWI